MSHPAVVKWVAGVSAALFVAFTAWAGNALVDVRDSTLKLTIEVQQMRREAEYSTTQNTALSLATNRAQDKRLDKLESSVDQLREWVRTR